MYDSRLRELGDTIKYSSICSIGIPEEERQNGAETLSEETRAVNFPHLERKSRSRRPREPLT